LIDFAGLNFATNNWKEKAISIGKQIITQQKEKDKRQNDEIGKANLPSNISGFLKDASKAGATITIKN
jgi:hypothetical protein